MEKLTLTTHQITLDQWTSYFNKLHNTQHLKDIDKDFQSKIINKLATTIGTQKHMEILDKKFTNEEIHEGINKLKINKASGIDSLSNEMIKAGNEILRPYICKLFNAILFSEYYPVVNRLHSADS